MKGTHVFSASSSSFFALDGFSSSISASGEEEGRATACRLTVDFGFSSSSLLSTTAFERFLDVAFLDTGLTGVSSSSLLSLSVMDGREGWLDAAEEEATISTSSSELSDETVRSRDPKGAILTRLQIGRCPVEEVRGRGLLFGSEEGKVSVMRTERQRGRRTGSSRTPSQLS
jgi:hypothetical protein